MKSVSSFSRWIGGGLALAALCAFSTTQAAVGRATVTAVHGTSASYSEQGGSWMPLRTGRVLGPGASVRTGVNTEVDLYLGANGPTVRLLEDTTLGLDKLDIDRTGPETVIETQLDLRQGTIQGKVSKLAAASNYEVKTPHAVAGIRGTEYEISADLVVCIKGSIMVAYTNPVTSRISTHLVNEGMTFVPPADPAAPGATPMVRPTQEGDTKGRRGAPPPKGGAVNVAVTEVVISTFIPDAD